MTKYYICYILKYRYEVKITMRFSIKKQILLFIVGSILNAVLFCLTRYTGLYENMPFWVDYTGSVYISILCGPLIGGISLILHTVAISILLGKYAFLSAIPIVLIIVVIYIFLQNDSRNFQGGMAAAFLSSIIAYISNIVIMLSFGPVGKYQFYSESYTLLSSQSGKFAASLMTCAIFTFIEVIVCFAILVVVILLTPKREGNVIFKK